MRFPPGIDSLNRLMEVLLRLPTGVFPQLVIISDIEQLIAGTGALHGVLNLLAGDRFDFVHHLKERHRIAHPAANVVDLSRGLLETRAYLFKRIDQVMYTQNV